MAKVLADIAKKVSGGQYVRAGFLEKTKYADGTPTAQIAMIQEFGATIEREAYETTVYRQVNKAGTGFNKNGRFVKKRQANFSTTHEVEAHTIIIPSRPFFRQTIAENKNQWGPKLGKELKANGYNAKAALLVMGDQIQKDLQKKILAFSDPPNAPSTIAKKKFDKPLIDDGTMKNSVDYDIKGQSE